MCRRCRCRRSSTALSPSLENCECLWVVSCVIESRVWRRRMRSGYRPEEVAFRGFHKGPNRRDFQFLQHWFDQGGDRSFKRTPDCFAPAGIQARDLEEGVEMISEQVDAILRFIAWCPTGCFYVQFVLRLGGAMLNLR